VPLGPEAGALVRRWGDEAAAALGRRAEALGPEEVARVTSRWPLGSAQDHGTPPRDARILSGPLSGRQGPTASPPVDPNDSTP